MLISRETDYAIRILRKLQDGDLHAAGDVARSEYVPEAFAYKILNKLTRAEIVEAVRGNTGGYRLAKDLKSVTVHDLFMALGAQFYLNACLDPNKDCPWRDTHGHCAAHENLSVLQREIGSLLKKLSIQDLLKPRKKTIGAY